MRREPNPVVSIGFEQAIQVDTLVADNQSPTLLFFALNLVEDVISLTFNEPVRVSSMRYETITLLSAATTSALDAYNLTGGQNTVATNVNGTMVLIGHLEPPDIRYLKLSTLLATSLQDTWLSILPGGINDMAGNPLVGIPPGLSLACIWIC